MSSQQSNYRLVEREVQSIARELRERIGQHVNSLNFNNIWQLDLYKPNNGFDLLLCFITQISFVVKQKQQLSSAKADVCLLCLQFSSKVCAEKKICSALNELNKISY